MGGKYQAYLKYKDSGIEWLGNIPDHWSRMKFKFFSRQGKIFASGPFGSSIGSQFYRDYGVPVIRGNNLSLDGNKPKYLDNGYVFLAEEKADELSNAEVIPGDLVFTARGTVGQVGLVPTDGEIKWERAILSANQLRFRNKNTNISSSYIWYLFSSWLMRTQILLNSDSVAQPNLNLGSLKGLQLLSPELYEQEIIASFLDHETAKIDTLIEKQQQLIKLLKEKRQAVISHAVTKGLNSDAPLRDSGVEWLGEVPEHWDIRAVSKLSNKITNGYVGPTRDILVSEGVPYVQATHIKKGKVNFDDAYFVRQPWSDAHAKSILAKGDVLIVQTGAGTGDIGLVTEHEVGFNCHALIIVQPKKNVISGKYLTMAFQSQYGYSVLYSIRTGGMHPHLNCGEVQYVKLPVPPQDEQNEITDYISQQVMKFDKLVERQLDAIALMQERRTALISAAVTGKIDVRAWQAPQQKNKEVAA